MPYTVPSLETTLGRAIAMFRAMFPTANVGSKVSFHWRRLKAIAMAVTDLHYHIDREFADAMPDTATGDAAVRWAKVVGVEPKAATPARKSAALRVSGTVGSAVAVGDELTHPATGYTYQVNEAETIGAAGYVDVDIVAISTGAATRLLAGEVLEFNSPPAGITAQAELQLDMDEDGFDAEQEGELHNRAMDRWRYAATGGSQADYVAWAREVTGITYAFCYPNRAGLGSIDVAALHAGTGSSRLLSETERAALLVALQAKAPAYLAATGGALRVLNVVEEAAAVEVTLITTGASAYDFDWDDSTPGTVSSWTSATRTLTFVARPATLKAGDRICFKGVASSQDGKPYVVESIGAGNTVVLEEEPTVAPAATDLVYAGGPLTKPIRDALLAHANGDVVYAGTEYPVPGATATTTVNQKVIADGVGTANPDGEYGTWSGGLIRAMLSKIVTSARGVRNCSVVLPASDFEATDYAIPNDDDIGLVSATSVLVRKEW